MATLTTTLVDKHGATGYKKGCRCDTCKDAKARARLRQQAAKLATAPAPSVVDSFSFAFTCPKCGGYVEHENASRPTDLGTRSTAVVRCTKNGCRRRWFLVLTCHHFESDGALAF